MMEPASRSRSLPRSALVPGDGFRNRHLFYVRSHASPAGGGGARPRAGVLGRRSRPTTILWSSTPARRGAQAGMGGSATAGRGASRCNLDLTSIGRPRRAEGVGQRSWPAGWGSDRTRAGGGGRDRPSASFSARAGPRTFEEAMSASRAARHRRCRRRCWCASPICTPRVETARRDRDPRRALLAGPYTRPLRKLGRLLVAAARRRRRGASAPALTRACQDALRAPGRGCATSNWRRETPRLRRPPRGSILAPAAPGFRGAARPWRSPRAKRGIRPRRAPLSSTSRRPHPMTGRRASRRRQHLRDWPVRRGGGALPRRADGRAARRRRRGGLPLLARGAVDHATAAARFIALATPTAPIPRLPKRQATCSRSAGRRRRRRLGRLLAEVERTPRLTAPGLPRRCVEAGCWTMPRNSAAPPWRCAPAMAPCCATSA